MPKKTILSTRCAFTHVQRGSSRESVFFEREDYQAYLSWLREASARYNCKVHAYVLMTNHIY